MTKVKIFGICYSPDQETEYMRYDNNATEKLWRFEYNPMLDIIETKVSDLSDDDYLGIFSWKFKQKTKLSKPMLSRLFNAEQRKDKSTQIYNLSPFLGNKIAGKWNFMDWSEDGHKGIKRLIELCCKRTGMKYCNDPIHVVYANQFLAKKSVYVDYMNRVIKPSLELLETELWEIVNKDAGYTAGIERDELKRLTGLEFYNYVPFVLERMLMQYIHNRKIKTRRLI